MTRLSLRLRGRVGSHQRGAALITATVLLLVVTVLGVSGLVTALLELQMSGNLQYQERAFQAADFAIEQAINSADLSTAYTYANPKVFPAPGVDAFVPGSPSDTYTYRMYYDSSAGSTPVPKGSDAGTVQMAYHFVIAGTGHSSRGAQDTHVQGFYVRGPADCDLAGASCSFASTKRERTSWSQSGAE
jgi:PilX N-terminal